MDIARPSNARQKRIRQALYIGGGLLLVALVSVGLSRLRPAAPTVEAGTVWRDTGKRGPMLRQGRGTGPLRAGGTRWVPGPALGRVGKNMLRPGSQGQAG